jgi:hypothetical protein
MARLHIDKGYFAKGGKRWVSFETSPHLENTKAGIYGRCAPCIMNLYEQLREGRTELRLGAAYQCWKIVVLVRDVEECIDFLDAFEKEFLGDAQVKGRFGSGDEDRETKVIVFNAEGEEEKDRLYRQVEACAARVNPRWRVSFHRACAELYHDLLGDWRVWKEEETIKRPEMVEPVLRRIKKALFWERDEAP